MINIKEVLELHYKYLAGEAGGVLANLENANLSGAYLTDANLRDVNLRYANLRYAKLRYADLSGAELTGADLTGANLRWANLIDANLSGTDLEGANLFGTNLEGADLRDASLRCADLKCAKLNRANLSGANLEGSYLRGTKFTEDQAASIQRQILSKFEKNRRGNYIAYKTFGYHQKGELPVGWSLKQRCIIEEPRIERSDRITCGPGINVATLEWVRTFIKDHHWYYTDIWKVELLCDPVVPLASDGKIRCEKVKLIRIVE